MSVNDGDLAANLIVLKRDGHWNSWGVTCIELFIHIYDDFHAWIAATDESLEGY
jgi:hypothetical protein